MRDESISAESAADAEKNELKPWLNPGNAEFVCAMEDVLEVYRPYATTRCWCAWTRPANNRRRRASARPARPGASGVYDYEYERNGVSNLFMLFAPLEGWRQVEVTDPPKSIGRGWSGSWWTRTTRTQTDRVVMDNRPSPRCDAFEPAEARRIAALEIHYTPKHGSWLNMALGVGLNQPRFKRVKGVATPTP